MVKRSVARDKGLREPLTPEEVKGLMKDMHPDAAEVLSLSDETKNILSANAKNIDPVEDGVDSVEDEAVALANAAFTAPEEKINETPQEADVRERTYDLPFERVLQIIKYDPRKPPNEEGVLIIKAIARAWTLPLGCMAWISSRGGGGGPYITFEGVLYRIHKDPRQVMAITTSIIERPTKENGFTIVVNGTCKFASGAEFSAIGAVSESERSELGHGGRYLLADTKAARRACMRAVGVPFPVYEDMLEFEEQQKSMATSNARGGGFARSESSSEVTRSTVAQAVAGKPVDGTGALLAEALGKGIKLNDMLTRLGVTELYQITDIVAARETLFGSPE